MQDLVKQMKTLRRHLGGLFRERATTPVEQQGGLEVAIGLVLAEMRDLGARLKRREHRQERLAG